MKSLRESGIYSDAELAREYSEMIAAEQSRRRSIRIILKEDYYQTQRGILLQQLAEVQAKLDRLDKAHQNGEQDLEDSLAREREVRSELAVVRNRKKIEKLLKLSQEQARLLQQVGASNEADES